MRRNGPNWLRWISISLLVAGAAFSFYFLIAFSRQRTRLPPSLTIGGIPVGGLGQAAASERLLQAYGTPVELHYGDQLILLSPAATGFRLDTEAMMAAAELARTGGGFWAGFWDYLWNRSGEPQDIPLRFEVSRSQLETTLLDIALRYDQPPVPLQPIPGSTNFGAGVPGRVLDQGRAAEMAEEVLRSPTNRRLNLPVVQRNAAPPGLEVLQTLLEQNIDLAGFDGLTVIYLKNLKTAEVLHFGRFRNQAIELEPDVAFTAASTIKIPIMVAYDRFFDEPLGEEADRWLKEMITLSGNDPADWLMDQIDRGRGPLVVTDVLREIGLENTFLAGYFRPGAELLRRFTTSANQRVDISTQPDIYNQTTASEIGMLLSDIYACASGGGTLRAVFPEGIQPSECRKMLDLLAQNKIGVLLEAGVPEGTRVAHKHGWTESPLTWLSDVGVIYTPGGDYAIAAFMWNDREMIWEPTSRLMADLSRAIYNYYNPPTG